MSGLLILDIFNKTSDPYDGKVSVSYDRDLKNIANIAGAKK